MRPRVPLLILALLAAVPCHAQTPAADEARRFVEEAETRLNELNIESAHAGWVHENFITADTQFLAAHASQRSLSEAARIAKAAVKYDGLALPADLRRKLTLLKRGRTLATPADPQESAEATRLAASLEGRYGQGKYCRPGSANGKEQPCLNVDDITRVLANSRNPAELQDAWTGWHAIGAPMRADYQSFVALSNKGARELGFKDTGEMWRSKYDMPPAEFAQELDRLWEQVRPLYVSLYSYVRWKLREKYGAAAVPASGPIPAHLLGNIWAQDWSNIYPLVAPADADPGYDLTEILRSRNTSAVAMVHTAENFFTSLGFPPLPQTFWERSLFVRPRDREVLCHADAWDIDGKDDLRVKVCLEPTAEDFSTIHHELGHLFYDRAYSKQPPVFRSAPNDGFHEAIGDTIALSITPEYLAKIGLIGQGAQGVPPASKDIGLLLHQALERVAFLPFGLMIDEWRWKVFSGEIAPADYSKGWWDLRLKYQGVVPPVARTETDFDPGAKMHVASNTPYARYFMAYVLEFQFHRTLARAAGCPATTPLHRCSIYGSKEAGAKLNSMLELGAGKPWPEALFELTGSRRMDASAIADYFAPLKTWLDEQNRGKPLGW